ncbi:hypothetical protein [Deinococcus sedimenti]|nr:hypothetical protein [Deinococcus sedimenti]
MKKLMLAAVGLTGFLASCGSSGVAPDGSGSARVVEVRTEYTVQGSSPARYVGCDLVKNATSESSVTQVVVKFAAAGSIQNVQVTLRGVTSAANNDAVTIPSSQLTKDQDGNYSAVFDFDSSSGKVLPASIVVTPTQPAIRPVKTVTVNAADRVGAFYADLLVKTDTSSIAISSRGLGTVDVYSSCYSATAQPLSR